MFHEVRRNSYSIATSFGDDAGYFNEPEIIGLDQSIPGSIVESTVLTAVLIFYKPVCNPLYDKTTVNERF
jgi:hypothetical protein